MRLINIKQSVYETLKNIKESRNCDEILFREIHKAQNEMIDTFLYPTILRLITEGKLAKFESIRRCRQLLQRQFHELRGSNYINRHIHQDRVKADLRELESCSH